MEAVVAGGQPGDGGGDADCAAVTTTGDTLENGLEVNGSSD